MIKFFRHFRQRMIKENRVSKYLLYAIGEIVLVVIGILIALQINTWNEQRKFRAQERDLLTQLKSEFESNQAQLEEKMDMRKDIIKSALLLLDYVDSQEPFHKDSLLKHVSQTTLTPTFDPIVNDLISSGRIQLLQSNALKDRLSLWTSEIVQVTEEEQALMRFMNSFYLQFLMDYYSTRNILSGFWVNNQTSSYLLDKGTPAMLNMGKSQRSFDREALLEQPQFEDHLAYIATMAQIANTQSVSLNNRISEILQLIDQELEEDQ